MQEIAPFHNWLRAHPTPASRYRSSGKAQSWTVRLVPKKNNDDRDGGDDDDDDDQEEHIFSVVLKSTEPTKFVHCTVRDSIAADHTHPNSKHWRNSDYRHERISFASLAEFCTTDEQKKAFEKAKKDARHGDYFTTGENDDYRGTSAYLFYGSPSELGGDAALVKTGREMGEAIPPEFYDAPNGYFSEFSETGRTITCDVVPPPAYLVQCDQYKKIASLWRRAKALYAGTAGGVLEGTADTAEVMKFTAVPFKASLSEINSERNPAEDGFLSYAEEEDDDDNNADPTVEYLGPRPRMSTLLQELLMVPAAGEDAGSWWGGLSATQKVDIFARESGQRRGRDDDENGDDDEAEKPVPKKPVPKKKAAAKKAANDDDDDEDAAAPVPAPKKPSPKKKDAAAAAAASVTWQFRADLDAESDDDDAWGDYASAVNDKLEEAYKGFTSATAAKKKTKKVKECEVSATHLVDFSHLVQFAKTDFNRQRGVRRVEKH